MKRLVLIMLIVCLLIPATCVYCEDETTATPFSCELTSSTVEDSALKIIVSSTQRSILTVCLLIDLGANVETEYVGNNFYQFILNDSYVASDGSFIVVSGHADGKILNIYYAPKTKEAYYNLFDANLSDTLMDYIVKTTAETQSFSYKNDSAELLQVFEIVGEVINGL